MPYQYISYKEKPFDALVCLDAELPNFDFFKSIQTSKIIAADGAFNKLHKIKIEPDIVIGDLDSLDRDFVNNKKTELIEIPSQDSNDFEKALNYCQENSYEDVLVTGFHGGELEHSLNNWSVFIKKSKELNLTIYDLERFGFVVSENTILETRANEIISLIPQPKVKLKTENLHWNLNNEILELGSREGARNKALRNEVKIEILDGEILLFSDSRLPKRPIKKK